MTLSKHDLLTRSDLTTREVYLPTFGDSVKIRSLPAAYSNQAATDAQETVLDRRGQQRSTINMRKLEEIKVLHSLIDPKLDTLEEAQAFAENTGPAWHALVKAIDEISGVDEESVKKIADQFPAGGSGEGAGAGEPDAAANGSGPGAHADPVRAGV